MNNTVEKIGFTTLGQTIESWCFGPNSAKSRVLVVGGVHGNENEGIELAHDLIRKLTTFNSDNSQFKIIPCLNKDGNVLNLRSNYNDVDLNRNLPTINWSSTYTNPRYKPGIAAGSESETKAFLNILEKFQPNFIISLHSYTESLILYCPADGTFNSHVEYLSQKLGIRIVDKMSYEVFGSLNTLCKEFNIPAITLEAPRGEEWHLKQDLFKSELFNFIIGI